MFTNKKFIFAAAMLGLASTAILGSSQALAQNAHHKAYSYSAEYGYRSDTPQFNWENLHSGGGY